LLAFASIGAKLLAVLRDRLLAGSFGADRALDIYYASFRLPDLLYVLSLFLVSTTALIPLFLEKKDFISRRLFINQVFTIFFFSIVALGVITFFLVPCIIGVIAPGFSAEDTSVLIKFSRILLLSPFLLGLSNLVSSVIQSFNRFFVYALSGVLYNAGIIFGLLVLYPVMGINGVIWGVVAGALLHFLIQVPSLVSLGFFPRFALSISFKEIKRVVALSLPRTFGLTLHQLVLLVITAMASLLAAGSITIFNLASNLQAIPLGVIALSYSVAAFPTLAKSFINQKKEDFIFAVDSSFRHIIFWLLPVTVLFIVLRAQIVRVLLGAGAFSWTDTRLTAAALALFAVSLFAQGLILLLVRAFYAAGKTRAPLVINFISSVLIIIFALGFLLILKHSAGILTVFDRILRVEQVSGSAVLFLPLAYSLGMIINFFFLFVSFERIFGRILDRIKKSVVQVFLTSLLIGVVSYFALSVFDDLFGLDTFFGVFMQGFLSGLSGLFAGFVLLNLLKNKELKEITTSLQKRFTKRVIIRPEPEELP